jgi:hypothetical protein
MHTLLDSLSLSHLIVINPIQLQPVHKSGLQLSYKMGFPLSEYLFIFSSVLTAGGRDQLGEPSQTSVTWTQITSIKVCIGPDQIVTVPANSHFSLSP